MRKNGLRAFGLCIVAALGLMAFSASGAQAAGCTAANPTAKPCWMVNGANWTAGEQGIQTEGLEGNDGALLAKVGTVAVKILCTNMEFEEGVLKSEGKSLGFIKFTGCKIFLNGSSTASAPCEPHTGAEKGVILTTKLKDEIILHPAVSATEGYDLLEPETGNVFVNIALSEECAIGESLPVVGKFVIEDCLKEGTVEKITHLIKEFTPLTKLFVINEVAEHAATIDGSANVKLTGANEGKKWSGLPA